MLHDLVELFREDKLGAALLLTLLALVGLLPSQVLRFLKTRQSNGEESNRKLSDSAKRIAKLEAERESRLHAHFAKFNDLSGIVQELVFKVKESEKDISELSRRLDAGEEATQDFRERLLRLEVSATEFARHARAARQSLERRTEEEA